MMQLHFSAMSAVNVLYIPQRMVADQHTLPQQHVRNMVHKNGRAVYMTVAQCPEMQDNNIRIRTAMTTVQLQLGCLQQHCS